MIISLALVLRTAVATPAFIFVGSGIEVDSTNDQCITDGYGNYANNEAATITSLNGGTLYAIGSFSTESGYDYLTIKGLRHEGTASFPTNIVLNAGEQFTWRTDGSVTRGGFTLCICSGTAGAYSMVGTACSHYTQTTCPAGYWGDASTMTCAKCATNAVSPFGSTAIADCTCEAGFYGNGGTAACAQCDATAGRVSNGVVGAATESGACVDAAFTYTGSGVELLSKLCITDGVDDYGANEKATITVRKVGRIFSVGVWKTANAYNDYILLNGVKYGGLVPPPAVALKVGDTFVWQSSGWYHSEGWTLCLCDTQGSYKAFIDGLCMTFTQTSCPTGYWGDSVTSSCIKCDHSVGRVGNGLLNATAEADACVDAAFTFTGSGIEYSSPTCITDGAGNYGANEAATITIVKSGVLMVIGTFATGNKNYDYLTVRNIRYGGSTPPGNLALSVGETIAWTTSSYTYMQSEGFTLCLCTLEGFKLFVNDACMTFTRTTCPTGYWGDSVTSTCVKCDHSAGRVGNGLLNATVEADACVDAAFTFSGSGIEYAAEPAAHECVTTGADSYGGNEQATITATVPGLLYTRSTFSTYSKYYDYLRFKGERYGGSVPPSHVLIQQGETLTWTTSSYSHTYGSYAGFTLCICDTTQPYAALVNAACKTYSIDSCPAGTWADESTQRCQECGSWLTSPIGSKSIAACAGVELKHHPAYVSCVASPASCHELVLDNQHIRGTIPPSVGTLTRLHRLNLDSNDLTGTLPQQLGDLTDLSTLSMSNNKISGTFPGFVAAKMSGLSKLSMSNNALSGTLHAALGGLKHLYALRLDNNRMSGTVPGELGKPEHLGLWPVYDYRGYGWAPYFTLHNNRFSGVGKEICALVNRAHSGESGLCTFSPNSEWTDGLFCPTCLNKSPCPPPVECLLLSEQERIIIGVSLGGAAVMTLVLVVLCPFAVMLCLFVCRQIRTGGKGVCYASTCRVEHEYEHVSGLDPRNWHNAGLCYFAIRRFKVGECCGEKCCKTTTRAQGTADSENRDATGDDSESSDDVTFGFRNPHAEGLHKVQDEHSAAKFTANKAHLEQPEPVDVDKVLKQDDPPVLQDKGVTIDAPSLPRGINSASAPSDAVAALSPTSQRRSRRKRRQSALDAASTPSSISTVSGGQVSPKSMDARAPAMEQALTPTRQRSPRRKRRQSALDAASAPSPLSTTPGGQVRPKSMEASALAMERTGSSHAV